MRPTNTDPNNQAIPPSLIDKICSDLAQNRSVHATLPGGVVINFDRLVPFLCVYRQDPRRTDAGTQRFVTTEAAFLSAPGNAQVRRGLRPLIRRIAKLSADHFGGFLILEIWSAQEQKSLAGKGVTSKALPLPGFCIKTNHPHYPLEAVAALEFALQRLCLQRQQAEVSIDLHSPPNPPAMKPLLSPKEAAQLKTHVIGLEIRPIYRDPASGDVYTSILQSLQLSLSTVLKKTFFAYALNQTRVRPEHFYSLGRKKLSRTVWNVDRQLADVSRQFNFILQVTPVNAEQSWLAFQDSGCETNPKFDYRPLASDPLLLKRRLLQIRTEAVEDPTLGNLLRDTQDELDRQITMLADIDSDRFLAGSQQVFGRVSAPLLQTSLNILEQLTPADRADPNSSDQLDARAFARRATREIAYYRAQSTEFVATASVRGDLYSGLLAASGNLLIGQNTSIPKRRADALLEHEIGVHLVTYYNGKTQPLRLLQVGLAGYDGLQEGLAVLAEYLMGGLTPGRLRLLAARVVAVDAMSRGMLFAQTYQLLTEQFHMQPRTAYTVVVRVYRGGGLTKDAVYLDGLIKVLAYFEHGGDISPLLVGKLAFEHIPVIRELLLRGVLKPPSLRPRFLENKAAMRRLESLRAGKSPMDLLIE
jgi:uncharacterized protein (TIGR02421 family)